jgi:hypothetical protein
MKEKKSISELKGNNIDIEKESRELRSIKNFFIVAIIYLFILILYLVWMHSNYPTSPLSGFSIGIIVFNIVAYAACLSLLYRKKGVVVYVYGIFLVLGAISLIFSRYPLGIIGLIVGIYLLIVMNSLRKKKILQ